MKRTSITIDEREAGHALLGLGPTQLKSVDKATMRAAFIIIE